MCTEHPHGLLPPQIPWSSGKLLNPHPTPISGPKWRTGERGICAALHGIGFIRPVILWNYVNNVSRFGKTSYEATCLDMLEQGCHRAFKELFDINEQQKADREAAGKDSGYYYDPMVIDSDEKLQHLKTFLITGEVGQRTGK